MTIYDNMKYNIMRLSKISEAFCESNCLRANFHDLKDSLLDSKVKFKVKYAQFILKIDK